MAQRPVDPKLPQGSLQSNANQIAVGPSALTEAHNLDFTEPGSLKPRRGFDFDTNLGPGGTELPDAIVMGLAVHDDTLVTIDTDGDVKWKDSTSKGITTETMTNDMLNGYGTIRFAYMNQNLYYTTDRGIRRLTGDDASPEATGLGDVLPPTFLRYLGPPQYPGLLSTGAPLWLPAGEFVGYKAVIGLRDANDNVHLSRVGDQIVVENTAAGARAVSLRVNFGASVPTTDHFIQVYRTRNFTTSAVDEEYYLTFEQTLTSSDVTTGYVDVEDYLPEELLETPLYVNPSQEGAAGENRPPPISSDLAPFADRMFYAHKKSSYTVTSQLAAVAIASTDVGLKAKDLGSCTVTSGSPTITGIADTSWAEAGMQISVAMPGFAQGAEILSKTASSITMDVNSSASASPAALYIGDYITIGSTSYHAVEDVTTPLSGNMFWVENSGTAVQNIEDTLDELLSAINRADTDGLQAYKVSDVPGAFAVEALNNTYSKTAFTFETNRPEAFLPNMLTTPEATRDEQEHLLFYSKYQQPEAVPLLNNIPIGSENFPILRLAALQNSLIIFKKDGVYQLTGTSPESFRMRVMDPNLQIIAPNSVAVVHNRAYALSDRGIVSVGENDIRIESSDIHTELFDVTDGFSVEDSAFQRNVFGHGIEDTGEYILQWSDSDYTCYVYSAISGRWCKWTFGAATRIYRMTSYIDGSVYFTDGFTRYVLKRSTRNDYDTSFEVTAGNYTATVGTQIIAIPKTEVEFQPQVGDEVYNSTNVATVGYVQTSVSNGSNWDVTLDTTWTAAELDDSTDVVDVYVCIPSLVVWSPYLGDSIDGAKHFDQLNLSLRSNEMSKHFAYFSTDVDGQDKFETLVDDHDETTVPTYSYETTRTPSGENAADAYAIGLPRGCRRTTRLRAGLHHRRARENYVLESASLTFKTSNSRGNRRRNT